MQHQKAGNLVGRDQARRLKYQELQHIKSKSKINDDQNKGQLKVYVGKLVK